MLDTLKQRHFLSGTQDNQKFHCVFVWGFFFFFGLPQQQRQFVFVFVKKADFRTTRNRPRPATPLLTRPVWTATTASFWACRRRAVNMCPRNASRPFLPAPSTNLGWETAAGNVRASSKALGAYAAVDWVNFWQGAESIVPGGGHSASGVSRQLWQV